MSALTQSPHLALRVEQQDRHLVGEPSPECRFCKCTEEKPCMIFFAEDRDGSWRLTFHEAESDFAVPCSWLAPGVCNAPECVEKLLLEARGRVILFDAGGKRATR